jgi:spore coat polysaccharide biosynthesis protein SpsF
MTALMTPSCATRPTPSGYQTDQEAFWAGQFGDDYVARNDGDRWVAANLSLFATALRRAGPIASCLEFGANIGLNLRALRLLFPQMDQRAIEINPLAAHRLEQVIGAGRVFNGSIFDYSVDTPADLVLIKGVLIHIHPDKLEATYRKLVEASRRWLLVCEYYNPSPVAIPYRGHSDRLFKRDFAGEMLDRFPQLTLVDYGFVYKRDRQWPQDDLTWFLLRKEA